MRLSARFVALVMTVLLAGLLAPTSFGADPPLDWQRWGLVKDVELNNHLALMTPGAVITLPDGRFRLYYQAGDSWTFSDTRSLISTDGIHWDPEPGHSPGPRQHGLDRRRGRRHHRHRQPGRR